MRKAIIGIFVLAYLSGVLTLVMGHLLSLQSGPEDVHSAEYLIEQVEDFPWVEYAHRHHSEEELLHYEQITYLCSVDSRIGSNLLYANWVTDFITEEEAQALEMLVSLARKDPQIAVNVAQANWFQKGISTDELSLMENIVTLSQQQYYVAKNITSSNWFMITGTSRTYQVVRTFMEMPADLALSVSRASWFKASASLSEFRAVEELITLYFHEKNLATRLPFVYDPQDFASLQQINELYSEDKELADLFFQYNILSRESYLALSDLSRIAAVDGELAHSLVSQLTEDRIQIISSLGDIYTVDPVLGKWAGETFENNKTALRYLQKILEIEREERELLEEVAVFVSDNPEFIYSDKTESYRYHLLTKILSEFPPDKAEEYKNLLFVVCSVYGSRFYRWENEEYNTLNGWSYDEQLFNEEMDAVITLLTFFMEKNEQGAFIVDLRTESHGYLYGLVDIPFTHLVGCDGTVKEAVHRDRGTGFVLAIMHNIDTLSERFERVQEQLQYTESVCYTYSNPLVDVILKEGEEQDIFFVYFCAKNWEADSCTKHVMNTRMDSIVTGISTTTMHWTASETAHIYPAYIPSSSIADKIQADPGMYGTPFVYKEFLAPYDEAGFKDSLDRDIEMVKIYDPQIEKKVTLFYRLRNGIIIDERIPIIIIGVILVVVGASILGVKK